MPEPISEDRAAQIVASIDHHYRVTGSLDGRRLACPACATASPAVSAQASADA